MTHYHADGGAKCVIQTSVTISGRHCVGLIHNFCLSVIPSLWRDAATISQSDEAGASRHNIRWPNEWSPTGAGVETSYICMTFGGLILRSNFGDVWGIVVIQISNWRNSSKREMTSILWPSDCQISWYKKHVYLQIYYLSHCISHCKGPWFHEWFWILSELARQRGKTPPQLIEESFKAKLGMSSCGREEIEEREWDRISRRTFAARTDERWHVIYVEEREEIRRSHPNSYVGVF